MSDVVKFRYKNPNEMVVRFICGRRFEFHGNFPTDVPRNIITKDEVRKLSDGGVLPEKVWSKKSKPSVKTVQDDVKVDCD